ncbi:hypothetical protein M405DRAFT_929772 [Rhizopogon salebrosus TDB-379]|nr:hypothetical protein M405DRAFT_929772 [Rhizopogon salebrosus TDB-379]
MIPTLQHPPITNAPSSTPSSALPTPFPRLLAPSHSCTQIHLPSITNANDLTQTERNPEGVKCKKDAGGQHLPTTPAPETDTNANADPVSPLHAREGPFHQEYAYKPPQHQKPMPTSTPTPTHSPTSPKHSVARTHSHTRIQSHPRTRAKGRPSKNTPSRESFDVFFP